MWRTKVKCTFTTLLVNAVTSSTRTLLLILWRSEGHGGTGTQAPQGGPGDWITVWSSRSTRPRVGPSRSPSETKLNVSGSPFPHGPSVTDSLLCACLCVVGALIRTSLLSVAGAETTGREVS